MTYSPQVSPRIPNCCRAFSLVEILVVIAMMSVLLGLGVSTINVWKSETLSAAGNRFADCVAMARQNSLSKNAYTAVVIKTQGDGAYAAFCLMELVRPDDNSSGTWKMLTPWNTLKEGVVFAPMSSTDSFLAATGNLPADLPTGITYRGQAVNFTTAAVAQVFQPDGTLSAGQMLRLRLAEGSANKTEGISLTRPTTEGVPANYYDIVFVRDSGQIKIERM